MKNNFLTGETSSHKDRKDSIGSTTLYRQVPSNIEAEQALLGALLVKNASFDKICDFLQPYHFFESLHAKIYEIISYLINLGKLANPVTLKPFISSSDKVGGITIFNYIVRLSNEAVTIINISDYGNIIYDLYIRRSLINLGEEIVNTAYHASIDLSPKTQIENIEKKLFHLVESGCYGNNFETFDESLKKAIDTANIARKRSYKISGIATYINSLDDRMGGLQSSDLIIIAGRPGMGKTSLATNIAFNIASSYQIYPNRPNNIFHQGGVVGFFSLEMSSEQLATRIISEQSEISSSKIRRGDITEDDFTRLMHVMHKMQKIPIYIDQTGGISITQLMVRARRLKRQHNVHVLIIDYIQLMKGSSRRITENRVQEITEITTNLKSLAKELNIPIIALSQLSRQVESREDKRPQLSDLRESGSIEQDADVVLFVYREEYYIKNREPKMDTENYFKWKKEVEKNIGIAEIIIAKQRHGPTGTIKLSFQPEFTRFSDFADEKYLPERYE